MKYQTTQFIAAGTVFALAAGTADAASLLHNWTFDTDFTDSAGSHDGTAIGDAAITNSGGGVFGEAVSLDGDGDSVFVNQSSLPATDFSLTAWVYRETETIQMYVAGTQNSGNDGAFLRAGFDSATDDRAFVNILPPGNATRIAGGSIDLNDWTHLAFTVSSTDGMKLYVDGVEVGDDPAAIGYNTFGNFRIGARPDGNTFGFDGLIDDVAVFDGVLTQGELNTVISSGAAAVPEPGSLALLGLGGLLMSRRRRN